MAIPEGPWYNSKSYYRVTFTYKGMKFLVAVEKRLVGHARAWFVCEEPYFPHNYRMILLDSGYEHDTRKPGFTCCTFSERSTLTQVWIKINPLMCIAARKSPRVRKWVDYCLGKRP